MTISATTFRASMDPIRARSISAFGSAGSGVIAGGTTGPQAALAYLYSAAVSGVTTMPVSGQTGLGHMFMFSDTQTASGAYAVQASGAVAHFTNAASGTMNPLTVNLGYLNSGASTASGIFVMDVAGTIANYNGSWALVTTNGIPHTGPYHKLRFDGTSNLYCLSQTSVEKLALANATSGTWSSMTTPFTGLLDGLSLNGVNPVVFGRIPLTASDVATDISEFSNQIVSLDSVAHALTISAYDTYGNITTSQTLSTTGVPVFMAPAVNQALVTDTTNNKLSTYTDSAGTWSGPTQTLACSGAAKINTSLDGTQALVCKPSINSLEGFKISGGSWSSIGTVAVSGATDVALSSSSQAYVAGASGMSVLTLAGSWSLGVTIPTPVKLTSITYDAFNTNMAYTCGTSASSGFVFAINAASSAVVSASFAGTADDIVYSNGYIAVLDNTNKQIHTYSFAGGVLSSPSIFNLPPTPTNYTRLRKGLLDRVMACTSSGWYVLRIKYPFQTDTYKQNIVTQWSGSAWVSAFFGFPLMTTICNDGTFTYCFRYDNMMIKINTSGTVQAGYPQTVPDFSGQTSGTPMGFSSSLVQNSTIYLASSLGGGITLVTGY